jgi:hypothetical protein
MASPNEQLFLDRFIAYNQDRYKDELNFVNALASLTIGQVTFTNFRKTDTAGIITYLVDVDSPQLFTGVDQKYQPADYVANGPANLIDPTPLALADLKTKAVQGIYLLSGEGDSVSGAVLVRNGSLTAEVVLQIIKDSCLYVLSDEEISIDQLVTSAIIDSHTVVGTLTIVEADPTGTPKYDGTYKYDGTIKY